MLIHYLQLFSLGPWCVESHPCFPLLWRRPRSTGVVFLVLLPFMVSPPHLDPAGQAYVVSAPLSVGKHMHRRKFPPDFGTARGPYPDIPYLAQAYVIFLYFLDPIPFYKFASRSREIPGSLPRGSIPCVCVFALFTMHVSTENPSPTSTE